MQVPGSRKPAIVAAIGALTGLALLWGAQPAMANSLTRVSFRANATNATTFKNIFDSGLVIRARCGSTGNLDVRLATRFDNATMHMNSQSSGDDADYSEEDDFDIADGNLDPFRSGDSGGLGDGATPASEASNSGQIAYSRPGGVGVTVAWASGEEEAPFGGGYDCAFVGTARVLDSGTSRVRFIEHANMPERTFFSLGGLTLKGDCSGSTQQITASSGFNNAIIATNAQQGVLGPSYEQNGDFDQGEEFVLPVDDGAAGQIVYARPGGVNVTIDWMGEEGLTLPTPGCLFVGTARIRESGDPKRVNYRALADTDEVDFFSGGGLRLSAFCGGTGMGTLETFGSSSSRHALVHLNRQGETIASEYAEDDNFNTNRLNDTLPVASDDDSMGQIVYATESGSVTTVNWLAQENGVVLGGSNCAFVGTAEVASP